MQTVKMVERINPAHGLHWLVIREIGVHCSGKLLGVGQHIHDYSFGLKLYQVTWNEKMVALFPRMGPEGRLLSIPIVLFLDLSGDPLCGGDIIKSGS